MPFILNNSSVLHMFNIYSGDNPALPTFAEILRSAVGIISNYVLFDEQCMASGLFANKGRWTEECLHGGLESVSVFTVV